MWTAVFWPSDTENRIKELRFSDSVSLLPWPHIHGSPRRFYYGLNLTDDPRNAYFRSPIRMHYIGKIKYY